MGLGYLNATSNGSRTSSRLIMLNNGSDRPTKVPPTSISMCLLRRVAQYVRSNNMAEGIHTGTATKSYGYPNANHAPFATHV